MIPVHCKPVTQTGRETGSYILCHSLSWQKFSAQDRKAELGMKEKLFWLNLRCTGKTGQVWRKWDFRKLAGITKSQGTALLSPGFKSITTFKLKKKGKDEEGKHSSTFQFQSQSTSCFVSWAAVSCNGPNKGFGARGTVTTKPWPSSAPWPLRKRRGDISLRSAGWILLDKLKRLGQNILGYFWFCFSK